MQETDLFTVQTQPLSETRSSRLRSLRYDLLLILISLIWGATFLVTKYTLRFIGPFTYLALCYAVATLTLACLFRRRLRHITRQEIVSGSLIGLVLFAGYALQTIGLQWTTVSKAAFITGLYVPLVPLCSLLLLRQRVPGVALLGVACSVLGFFLLSINRQLNLAFGPGEWLLFCCAISFALQITLVSKFAPTADAVNLAIVQLALTSLLSFLAIPIAHEPIAPPPAGVWLTILLLGTCDMAFTLLVMNWIQQFVSSTRATLIYSLEPMWASGFGMLFAGDTLSLIAWIGCLFIFIGMIIGRFDTHKLPERKHT